MSTGGVKQVDENSFKQVLPSVSHGDWNKVTLPDCNKKVLKLEKLRTFFYEWFSKYLSIYHGNSSEGQ